MTPGRAASPPNKPRSAPSSPQEGAGAAANAGGGVGSSSTCQPRDSRPVPLSASDSALHGRGAAAAAAAASAAATPAAPKSAADVRLYELQLHVAALERRQIEREHELGTLVRHTKQFAALEVGRTRREYEAALAEKDAEVDGFRRELDALIDEMGLLVEAAREQAAQAMAAAA